MIGDVEKMVAVGLVWGATNAIMRRGALLWDEALKSTSRPPQAQEQAPPHHKLIASLKNWLTLLSIWQYSVPFLINLSASYTFFAILSHTPISLTVPVTNATTFAATAVFGLLLGEKTRVAHALIDAKCSLSKQEHETAEDKTQMKNSIIIGDKQIMFTGCVIQHKLKIIAIS